MACVACDDSDEEANIWTYNTDQIFALLGELVGITWSCLSALKLRRCHMGDAVTNGEVN